MLFAKMPVGKDDDKQDTLGVTIKRLAKNKIYRGGIVAQFFYLGAQIGVWSYTIGIVMRELGIVVAQASNVYLVAVIGFGLSRFVYTWLMQWFKPVNLLTFGGTMSLLMSLIVAFTSGSGWLLVAALVLISCFMSLMFPTIYGLALGGIAEGCHPEDSKIGASGLIMAISGGALLTPVQGMVSDSYGIYQSYLVPAFCFLVVTAYACYVKRVQKG